jgi:hypothetical protein
LFKEYQQFGVGDKGLERMGSGAVSLTRCGGEAGDPSLRLKYGYVRDDADEKVRDWNPVLRDDADERFAIGIQSFGMKRTRRFVTGIQSFGMTQTRGFATGIRFF